MTKSTSFYCRSSINQSAGRSWSPVRWRNAPWVRDELAWTRTVGKRGLGGLCSIGLLASVVLTTGLWALSSLADTPSANVPSRPLVQSLPSTTTSEMPVPFANWLSNFAVRAGAAGITEQTLNSALADLQPNQQLLDLDRRQSEYNQTFFAYLHNNVSERRIQRGRKLMALHADLLAGLERRYAVPGQVLIALWGMESDFGGNTGNYALFRSLATLAHAGRRRAFFEQQLLAALQIIDQGSSTPAGLRGSWAGAMGQLQFMPTTYLDYAVDGDDDGRADIWGNPADALASGAHYLWSVGWQPDLRWGWEVRLPNGFDFYQARLSNELPLSHWHSIGVTNADGRYLPSANRKGSILLPAGKDGPAFLVTSNFHVLTEWNRSLHYALTVAHLSDRLAGGDPLQSGPPANDQRLARRDVMAMQRDLDTLGYAVGAADGMVGFQTRHAVREYQRDQGLPADAYPTSTLIARIAADARPNSLAAARLPANSSAPSPAGDPGIASLQQDLLKLGFDPGRPDGLLGPKTRAALQAYQQRMGLPVTGEPSSELVARINADARAK